MPLCRTLRLLLGHCSWLVALVGSALSGAAVAAPQATWLRIGDVANPPALDVRTAVYDSVGDRLLAYTGYRVFDESPTPSGEIWAFRLSQPDSGWRMLVTSGTAPSGYTQSSMVLDAPNQRLLFMPGYPAYAGVGSNDLYQLSLSSTPTWSIVPAVKDTLRMRFDAFMCVDESTRSLVLYGGTGAFSDHYGGVVDLWTMPLDAAPVWALVPVTTPPPSRRTDRQYAWDPLRHRIMLHGGLNSSSTAVLTDTWGLTIGDTARWDSVAFTGLLFKRMSGGAIVDPLGDRMIVGPGSTRTYPPPTSERDTHVLPLGPGGQWSLAPTTTGFDGANFNYGAVLDTRRARMLTISSTQVQAFSLTDTSGWQRLWPPDPVQSPSTMQGHVVVSDVNGHALWTVGGTEPGGFEGLWRLNPAADAQWTWFPQTDALPPRGHAAVFDHAAGRILSVSLDYYFHEIVELGVIGAPSENVWAPRDTFPANRVDHAVAIDPVRQRLLVFGGQYFGAHFSGTSFGDLWTVPLNDLAAWSKLPTVGPQPGGRGSHFLFYDDLRERMVMFGGWQQTGGPIRNSYHDAWALSLAGTPTWSALSGPAWDPPTSGRITFDPVAHRLFLFHASTLGSPSTTVVYMRGIEDGDAWVELQAEGTGPAIDAPIAFAPWADRLVVVSTNSDGTQSDETWALQIDHSVPALASLENVDAAMDCVSLRWRLGASDGRAITLTRRASMQPWQTLAELLPDGDGRLTYEDHDVATGQSLTYRLSDGVRVLTETSVTVPGASVLSFAGARPAPARGAASIAFTLSEPSNVRIEFYDLRGARVLSRELGRQEAGSHLHHWRETATLRPGLYLARLFTETTSRDAKVVLLP